MSPKIEFSYASFLIRVWRQADLNEIDHANDWQGEVEQIQSGERWTFRTIDELLEFLRRRAEQLEGTRLTTAL